MWILWPADAALKHQGWREKVDPLASMTNDASGPRMAWVQEESGPIEISTLFWSSARTSTERAVSVAGVTPAVNDLALPSTVVLWACCQFPVLTGPVINGT